MRNDMELRDPRHPGSDGPYVPAILAVPKDHPAPVTLLLHGLGSRKKRMADTVGRALLKHGVASMAVDLPLHGAREDSALHVRALAGSDLPDGIPFESFVRAAVNPLRAIRALEGRPLLMINGRYDRTVKPAQAERLYAAAAAPRTLRWYNGGHWPPEREIEFAAKWMATSLIPWLRRPRTTASTNA